LKWDNLSRHTSQTAPTHCNITINQNIHILGTQAGFLKTMSSSNVVRNLRIVNPRIRISSKFKDLPAHNTKCPLHSDNQCTLYNVSIVASLVPRWKRMPSITCLHTCLICVIKCHRGTEHKVSQLKPAYIVTRLIVNITHIKVLQKRRLLDSSLTYIASYTMGRLKSLTCH